MDEKKEKRVLSIELDDNVKKVSITGLGDDETVVMKQELSEDELDQATGGMSNSTAPVHTWNSGICGIHMGCTKTAHIPCRYKTITD